MMKYLDDNGNSTYICGSNPTPCANLSPTKTVLYQTIRFPPEFSQQALSIKSLGNLIPVNTIAPGAARVSPNFSPPTMPCKTQMNGLIYASAKTRDASSHKEIQLHLENSSAECIRKNAEMACSINDKICFPSPIGSNSSKYRCNHVSKVVKYTYTINLELVPQEIQIPCLDFDGPGNYPSFPTIIASHSFGYKTEYCEDNNPCNTSCNREAFPSKVKLVNAPFTEYSVQTGTTLSSNISNIAYHHKNTDCNNICNDSEQVKICNEIINSNILFDNYALQTCGCWSPDTICDRQFADSATLPYNAACDPYLITPLEIQTLGAPICDKIQTKYSVCTYTFDLGKAQLEQKYGPGILSKCFEIQNQPITKTIDYCNQTPNNQCIPTTGRQITYDTKLLDYPILYKNIVTKTYIKTSPVLISIPGLPMPGESPGVLQKESTKIFDNPIQPFNATVETVFCEIHYEEC